MRSFLYTHQKSQHYFCIAHVCRDYINDLSCHPEERSALSFICSIWRDICFHRQYYFSEKSVEALSTCITVCLRPQNSAPYNTEHKKNIKHLKLKELWLTELIIQISVPFHLSMKDSHSYAAYCVQLESHLYRQKTHSLEARNSMFSFPSITSTSSFLHIPANTRGIYY